MPARDIVFVLDFDGTITRQDVGNEICDKLAPEKFKTLQAKYRSKELTLREYQKTMWEGLTTSRENFKKLALEFSQLRNGVKEFFEECSLRSIDVFIASCGIRDYIETVLEKEIPLDTLKCVREIACHDAEFKNDALSKLLFRDPESISKEWPFDKGRWCRELKVRYPDDTIFVGVGNGTSDLNFVGSVDHILATDAFAKYCKSNKIPHTEFETFFEIRESINRFL